MTTDVQERNTTEITTPNDTQIRIERIFDAPRQLVWDVFTDPDLMHLWLGPRGRQVTVEHMDVRPGGTYRYTFPPNEPGGDEAIFTGEYRVVEAPSVLEGTFVFAMGELEYAPSVDRSELEDLGDGRTRLVITSTFLSTEERDGKLNSGMSKGVTEGYEELDQVLLDQQAGRNPTEITTPSDTEIRIERTFDAPRQLVWDVYTDAELLPEFMGPREHTTTVQEMDVRPGGKYRWTAHTETMGDVVFTGHYIEVEEPELLVATFAWEIDGTPSTPSVDRLELHELDGDRTRFVSISTFESKEERDAMISSGMERGVRATYERLDDVLAGLRTS